MHTLTRGGAVVRPLLVLADVIEEARKRQGGGALAALRDFARDPAAAGAIADIVAATGADAAKVAQFIRDHHDDLAVLLGSVGQARGHRFEWPLEISGGGELSAGSIEVGATLTASIEVDADDNLHDGLIRMEEPAKHFLGIGIEGTVGATAGVPAMPIAAGVRAKGAFSASSSIAVHNYSAEDQSAPFITALGAALAAWRLPLAGVPARGRFIHVGGTGSIAISGSIAWGKTLTTTGNVTVDELDLDAAPLTAEAKLSASIGFEAALDGDFDVVILEAGAGRVRIRLARSATSKRQASFTAGVGVSVKGVDRAALAALSQLTAPLDPLIAILDENAEKYSDLRALFREELESEVDRLLGKQEVIAQIESWLEEIGADVSLTAKLKELIVNAIDEKAGRFIDELQRGIDPAVKQIQELIRRYQKALARLRKAVQTAAQVRIGIELARTRKAVEQSDVALELEFDPQAHPQVWRRLIHGDYTEALRLAKEGREGVELIGGSLHREGTLSIDSSLGITAFGFGAGAGSVLAQEWTFDVSAAGDITIGASGSVKAWSKSWRTTRSITFLADTRVLGAIGSAGQLVDPALDERINVEMSAELRPPVDGLREWEGAMIELGVLAAKTSMEKDLRLAAEAHTNHPFGTLVLSAALPLDGEQLRALAGASTRQAGEVFARELARYYADERPSNMKDEDGAPIFNWPSVRAWQKSPLYHTTLQFAAPSGKKVQVRSDLLRLLALPAALVAHFESMHARLHRLSASPLSGLPAEEALEAIRREQRQLLADVRSILTATPLGREQLGRAFFSTIAKLAGGSDPFVVVLRAKDKKRFVYS
jgi:hypothetical protein